VDAISLEPLPFTSTDNQTSIDPQERFTEGIFSYIERTSPTFEDDFSSAKPEWGEINSPYSSKQFDEFISGGVLQLKDLN